MKIVMKDTVPGSVDGINIAIYEAGQEYHLTATAGERELAEAFVGADLAEEVGAQSPAADVAPADSADAAVDAPVPPAKPGRKPRA